MTVDEWLEAHGDTVTDSWVIDGTGVYREKTVKRGKEMYDVMEFASHTPIVPVCLYRNINTDVQKVELDYWTENRPCSIIVDRSVVSSRNSIVKLSDNGVDVTSESAKLMVEFLANCIALSNLPIKQSVSQMGWHDDDFVPYTSDVTFDGDRNYHSVFKAVTTHCGDRDAWVKFTYELRKNPLMRLMMDASFASPLIGKASQNPFVLMLWGGTGAGKTVASMVAMSIWGNPDKGKLLRTMNMTSNSMMSLSAFLNDLPFAGDELQTIKTYWSNYDSLIMKVTEGIDRGRLGDGGKVIETKSWNCAYLFTGEEPCTKQGSGGGVKNRVIEVECTTPVVTEGNKVVNFVRNNYGVIAKEYIQAINSMDVQSIYSSYYKTLMEMCDTTDKQAGSMALILTADKIVSEKIYNCPAWIGSNVYQWLRSGTEVDVAERAWDYICDTIAENSLCFDNEGYSGKTWGKTEGDSVYINSKVLEDLLNKNGYDLCAVKRKWHDKGYISKSDTGFSFTKSINGIHARYYKLNMKGD